ncbi:MAG: hypothetical protein ABI036_20955 [Fibrobacteria bacterium]
MRQKVGEEKWAEVSAGVLESLRGEFGDGPQTMSDRAWLGVSRKLRADKMNPSESIRLVFTLAATLSTAALAQADAWKKEMTDDGKVSVEYRVSRIKDTAGAEAPLIEFKASMTDSAGFEKCISTLMNVSNHKTFNGDEASETVRKVSETEWILYYNLKIPWPLPKTDCVVRMNFSRDTVNRSAEFSLVAAPDQAPPTGKRRFRVHQVSYTCKDLGNGKVELITAGKSSPPFKFPLWMIRASLPDAASDPLRIIMKLAKAGE